MSENTPVNSSPRARELEKTGLTTRQAQSVKQVAFMIARGEKPDAVRSRWERLITDATSNGDSIDANALVQEAIRESYLALAEDLRIYAEKVKYFNECKNLVREYLQRLRDFQQQFDAANADYLCRMRELNDELLSQIQSKEQELQSLDDAGQLAESDLDAQSQKVQEFLGTITNIQRVLGDVTHQVIQNLEP